MTESPVTVRPLDERDAEAFAALRRRSLEEEPLAFLSSPGDDVAATVESVRERLRQAPDAVVFGAFEDELVGAVGLYRGRHAKAAHKMHIWGMYVVPDHRRRNIGASLLQVAIAHARAQPGVCWVELTVTSAAPEARRLYERAGFVTWGTEPDAVRHGGHSVADDHMALRLM